VSSRSKSSRARVEPQQRRPPLGGVPTAAALGSRAAPRSAASPSSASARSTVLVPASVLSGERARPAWEPRPACRGCAGGAAPPRATPSGSATTSSSTCPSSTCPSGVTSCVQRSESSGAVQQLIPIGKRGSVPRAACLVYHHHSFGQCGCLMGLKGWSDDRLPQRSSGREKTQRFSL